MNVKLNNFDNVIGCRGPSLQIFRKDLHVENTIFDFFGIDLCSRLNKIGRIQLRY